MCENQLISRCQSAQHLKQRCAQNSEILLQMLVVVDETDGSRKSERLQALGCTVSVDRCMEDWLRFPFPGVTKTGTFRKRGPDNGAWC